MLNNHWQKGEIDGDKYWVLAFEEGSVYGIDGGRISKLDVRKPGGGFAANYDRAWDVLPFENKDQAVVSQIIKIYN